MARERSTVVGVFSDRDDAESAIDALHRAGFTDEQVGFAMRGGDGVAGATTTETGSNTGAGVVGGALAGAGIGGLIAAAAALLIPGFGPVVAGGILATVLGGAAVGAAAGGILGALVGIGVPEEEAHYYESEFNEGRILVTVKADGRYQEAQNILRRHHAYDIESQGSTATAAGATMRGDIARPDPHASREGASVELREEKLQARTTEVETGEVRVGKEVVTERQQIDVPVTREEVVIERRPVEGRPSGEAITEGEVLRVPVREEEVHLDKQAVVYEEVQVGTRDFHETERVSGEVRREEVRIEHEGDVTLHGAEASGVRGWSEVSPQYRQRWQARHGTGSGRWEDYEPGYRYGYEMAYDPRYQNREWGQVESDLRRDYGTWAQRAGYREDPNGWERFKDSVRETWEEARGRRRAA